MKISEIRIENFGKFKNFVYKFNGSGIEILNGENEFGKTTLVTFIQRILYGFPDKRKAENMYESPAEPYGGSILCIANDGRHITIERLRSSKNKTFRIFDTASGEELASDDYIRQGADFYRNIYMIHLKDLLDASTLDSGDIHHHLYGLERAFGAVSPLKIHEMLEKNCNSLYRPKGQTQDIPKLAKELKQYEKDLSTADAEIKSLTDQCADDDKISGEIQNLQNQIAVLEQIRSLKKNHHDLLQIAQKEFDGPMPDKFLLEHQDTINSLVERRCMIVEDAAAEKKLLEEISDLDQEIKGLDFTSHEEYEKSYTQYNIAKNAHAEQILRNEIAAEEYNKAILSSRFKRKMIFIFTAVFSLLGIIMLCFKIIPWAFAALPFMLIAYFITGTKQPATAEVADFENKDKYFEQQKILLDKNKKLSDAQENLTSLQKKYSDIIAELQLFNHYLPQTFSRSCDQEISILKQKLADAVRSDIQLDIHRKNTTKARKDADAIFDQILTLQSENQHINGTWETLNEKLSEKTKTNNELSILKQQLSAEIEHFNDLQIKYNAGKKNFNNLCREYLKWKTALKLWDKTIAIFETERQGEVMQTASKYFAEITANAYIAVRNAISSGEGLVVFDGHNNKTLDKLSSGTREQLLLVLRLALIEYIEKNSPANISMPLLMDDIFVNYDDSREKNAWHVLEKFAQNRQIIFCRAKNKI